MPKIQSVTLLTIQFEDGPDLVLPMPTTDTEGPEKDAIEGANRTSGKTATVREVFDYWVERTGRDRKRMILTNDRAQKIRTRLTRFSMEQLKEAIDYYAEDAWHQGDNPEGKRYDDICTIFKNDGKVAKALEDDMPPRIDDGRSRYRILGDDE